MVTGLWGKKIGMTQVFHENQVIPVTAIDISNWLITNIKTADKDGYTAVQVGCVKPRFINDVFALSWLKDLKKYFSKIREVRLVNDASLEGLVIGKPADFYNNLQTGDKVDVTGRTKGCGFAGVVRRHNFGGPPASHGSTMGNRPGSIGFNTACGNVIKGKKLPGHMGNRQRVVRNLEVVKVEPESNLMLVKGAIPGKSGSFVYIKKV